MWASVLYGFFMNERTKKNNNSHNDDVHHFLRMRWLFTKYSASECEKSEQYRGKSINGAIWRVNVIERRNKICWIGLISKHVCHFQCEICLAVWSRPFHPFCNKNCATKAVDATPSSAMWKSCECGTAMRPVCFCVGQTVDSIERRFSLFWFVLILSLKQNKTKNTLNCV